MGASASLPVSVGPPGRRHIVRLSAPGHSVMVAGGLSQTGARQVAEAINDFLTERPVWTGTRADCLARSAPHRSRGHGVDAQAAVAACCWYQLASYSAGGIRPHEPCRRWLFHHATHAAVARSTSAAVRHGPRRRINSALYKPLIVSARALSYESPLAPTELAMPASSSRVV